MMNTSLTSSNRGYCSYNNMAHVVEQGQYFLLRTKDIHSKGLVGNFEFPETESFDIDVAVTLTRSHSRKISVPQGTYRRFIDRASAFDFIEYGSLDTYTLAFRIARFPIGDGSCECIVTNFPREEFPPERLKALYHRRWSIESSFRKLKHTIGLGNYHSYKPEYIKQEIWANLIAYNIMEMLVNCAAIEKRETKYEYKVIWGSRVSFFCHFSHSKPYVAGTNLMTLVHGLSNVWVFCFF